MPREFILVVTDEQNIYNLLSLAISSHNTSLLFANELSAAAEMVQEQQVALVFLDWALAQDSEVLPQSLQAFSPASIIALLPGDSNAAELEDLGVDEYLVKPPPLNLLRLTLERALEKRRLKREAERLALINRVGQQITSILDMSKLLWEIARLIQQSFDFYYVGIALLDGDTAEVKAGVGGENDYLPPVGVRHKLHDDQSMIAQALSNRKPLLIADLPHAMPPEFVRARSALVMPIILQEELLGALEVLSADTDAFEIADLPLFESLTAQIAVAVQNAHLFAGRKKHEEILHSLNAAAVSMQRVITSRTQVLKVMASELGRSGFVSLVHLFDSNTPHASLLYSSLSPRLTKALTELVETSPENWLLDPARAPTYRQAMEEGQAVFIESIESLIEQVVPEPLSGDKIDLMIHILGNPLAVVAPMLSGDKSMGWLTVFSAHLTAEDALPITIFANQAAVALENARLLAGARRADALAQLNNAAQVMASTLEFDKVIRSLLRAAVSMLHVKECVVALWDDTSHSFIPRARLLDKEMSIIDLPGDDVIHEYSTLPLQLPLVARNQTLGLLTLGQRSDGRDLSADEIQLAQALANQAASALENARLYTELKQSAEELEFSQQRLIQSGKLAATGRLAASIAHEINNPLQAIKNCLELILDEAEAGQSLDRTYLDVAMSELERIRGIIQQMLNLYRPQQERMRAIDLNAAVEGVLSLMGKQLETHHIKVILNLDSNDPHIIGRDNQIRQVFINLILNAIEAMPQGGQISIKTWQNSDGLVSAQVTDTGLGIEPENLMRITDPFFTTKAKGVGLGLTICHEIIERHKGTLDVTSQIDHGSTFTFHLLAAEKRARIKELESKD